MKIPEIKSGLLASIEKDCLRPQRNTNWPIEFITKLKINNPVMAQFLLGVQDKFGPKASLVGLIVYRIIESQMEADELKELIE